MNSGDTSKMTERIGGRVVTMVWRGGLASVGIKTCRFPLQRGTAFWTPESIGKCSATSNTGNKSKSTATEAVIIPRERTGVGLGLWTVIEIF